jgi:crotonobetainyl-CoA:carnitine CoA-transferase CaiB-like acyl-CoA transferase
MRGQRVLDLSQGVAGPYCAQLLGQQGATVVKVEPPEGDWARHVGHALGGESTLSCLYNAGKRSLAVDAKHPDGLALLLQLAAQADVVIQNFRPQVVERLGLDHASLKARGLNPVYVSISGYGPDGPFAGNPATDSVMQADAGLMSTNRNADGTPQRVGFLLADVATGVYAAQACTAALLQKALTGQGTHVELNLFGVCCALQQAALNEDMDGLAPRQAVSAPNGVFEARDGRIMIVALTDDQFLRIARALGLAHWADDPRFATNAQRLAHKAVLHAELADAVRERPLAELEAVFAAHNVLHARMRTARDVVAHPQALHLGTFQSMPHDRLGTLYLAAMPGARPADGAVPEPAPRIGEHSRQILAELGLATAEVDALMAAGVVAEPGAAA